MQPITTYWWKYYSVSFFSILALNLLVSTLNFNIPYLFLVQIGLLFGLWYLISPFILILVFKMKSAPQDLALLVEEISNQFNVKVNRTFIINDDFLNAFAFGNIIFRGIAITLPLYESLTREETIAVVSHEIAHLRNYDPEVMLITIVSMSSVYAMVTSYLPFMLFPILLLLYILILFPLIFYVHRRIERRADLTAVRINPFITYWLESSLIKIGYLSKNIPNTMLKYIPPMEVFLVKEFIINNAVDRKGFLSFATHPSLRERLLYLTKYEQQKMYYL